MDQRDRHHLHLLRHTKSSWDDPALADHDRPLARRGRRAAAALAEHLLTLSSPPDLVLCSSAVRTTETLERVRSGLPGDVEVVVETALYHAGTGEILQLLRGLPDERRSVMVIGHNPSIHDLACLLAAAGDPALVDRLFTKYPTGGLASLGFDGEWAGLRPGSATLDDYVVPRDLT